MSASRIALAMPAERIIITRHSEKIEPPEGSAPKDFGCERHLESITGEHVSDMPLEALDMITLRARTVSAHGNFHKRPD